MKEFSDRKLGKKIAEIYDEGAGLIATKKGFHEYLGREIRWLFSEPGVMPEFGPEPGAEEEGSGSIWNALDRVNAILDEVLGAKGSPAGRPSYIPAPGEPCPQCGLLLSFAFGSGVDADGRSWSAPVGFCEACGPVVRPEESGSIKAFELHREEKSEEPHLASQEDFVAEERDASHREKVKQEVRKELAELNRQSLLEAYRNRAERFRVLSGWTQTQMENELGCGNYMAWIHEGAPQGPEFYQAIARVLAENIEAYYGTSGENSLQDRLYLWALTVGALDY
jgi:hypothetical protein